MEVRDNLRLLSINKPTYYNYQHWPFFNRDSKPNTIVNSQLAYSPLFIDLVDNDNQADYYRALAYSENWTEAELKKYPDDQVSGYLTPHLNYAATDVRNLEELREKLKNVLYLTDSEVAKIDKLFEGYIYYRK